MSAEPEAAPDFAEALIDHALGLGWAEVNEADRSAAGAFVYDTLAVGAAGARAVHAEAVLGIAQSWGRGNEAGVLGRPDTRLPAAGAAFVNAFQIHGQEFDCVHEGAVLHPMAGVLAALLAEGARGRAVPGALLLAAVIAGVDVAVTLGLAASGPLSFFRPATAGIFGAVAAIARLRTLPREVALDAFGHALAFASGTMQAHVEGRPALPLQVGNAARSALLAVDLARAGVSGVRQPLGGPFGYFALFETATTPAPALIAGHRIAEVSWKPFPTGRAGHGGIVAVQAMMAELGLTAAAIARLEYHAPPLIARLVGRPARADMQPGYARLCLPYLAAVTLRRGTVSLTDFARKSLDDPDTLALAARIAVVADGNPDPAAFVPARAEVSLTDGSRIVNEIACQLGSPKAPLSIAQQRAKGRDCLAFAGLAGLEPGLFDMVARLADAPDVLAAIRATGLMG